MTAQENSHPKPLSEQELSDAVNNILEANYQNELRSEKGLTPNFTERSRPLYGPLTRQQTESWKAHNQEDTVKLAEAQGATLPDPFRIPGRYTQPVEQHSQAESDDAFGYLKQMDPRKMKPFALSDEQAKKATAEMEAVHAERAEENKTEAVVGETPEPKDEGWTSLDDRALEAVAKLPTVMGDAVEKFSKNPPPLQENSILPLHPEWVKDGRDLNGPEKSVADYLGDFLDIAPPYRFETFMKFLRKVWGVRKDAEISDSKHSDQSSKNESTVSSAAD